MSCSLYFTEGSYPARAHRCASHLFFHPKGQTKVLTIAGCALDIADYATGQTNKSLQFTSGLLYDTKVALNFVCIPFEIELLSQKVIKAHHTFHQIYQQGGFVDHKMWICAGAQSAGVVKKTFSVLGDGLFKPMLAIGKWVDFGSVSDPLGKTWQACSMVKSTSKILGCVGKLYLGDRKPAKRVVQITLETWELVHAGLRVGGVSIHPIANIVLVALKIIFGLVDLWLKTV